MLDNMHLLLCICCKTLYALLFCCLTVLASCLEKNVVVLSFSLNLVYSTFYWYL